MQRLYISFLYRSIFLIVDNRYSKGDRVIISALSDKPHKVSFATKALKDNILDSEQNPYKLLYRASGNIKYKGDKIQEFVITDISVCGDEVTQDEQ